MNIDDVEDTKEIPDNALSIWKTIWEKQWQLAEKYKEIEGMGDLLETTDTNIDTAVGQKWIKDFAWRVTEELTEADESRIEFNNTENMALKEAWEESAYRTHYIEELTDALHFFIEMAIICGYNPIDFYGERFVKKDVYTAYDVVYYMGLACNCLKNKPWKQSQMLTDRPKFKKYMKEAFTCLENLFYEEGLDTIDIYQYYFKKNAVNKFRIRSKY